MKVVTAMVQMLAWVLVTTAAVVGALMVAVEMFEELPGIIRDVVNRDFKRRRS